MGRTMNDAAKWWYYVRQNGGYYPQTVANLGYDVWDWSTLNAGTLFQDSAKTTPASANGDVVGCWTDGVGGVDAVQATTANKPTYVTGSLGGLPTLSFDGSDLLSTGNISISTFAVWVVFRSSGANAAIYEHNTTTSSPDNMIHTTSNNGTISVRRNTTTASTKDLTLNWANDNTWRISRHESQGTHANHLLYLNNVNSNATTRAASNGDVGTGTATEPLFIGARSGVAIPMTGNIAHHCIVSPYPTAEIIAQMESYINGIWGVY